MPRRPRSPADRPHDHEVWENFTLEVKQLERRQRVASQAHPLPAPVKAGPQFHREPSQTITAGPPATLDRSDRRRLGRGTLRVDARIDLHGMTQATAHRRLLSFLQSAQAGGARLVIVITGKGSSDSDSDEELRGRGILRRAVPLWLEEPSFRAIVAAISQASRRHGGEGAYYVRLKTKTSIQRM